MWGHFSFLCQHHHLYHLSGATLCDLLQPLGRKIVDEDGLQALIELPLAQLLLGGLHNFAVTVNVKFVLLGPWRGRDLEHLGLEIL